MTQKFTKQPVCEKPASSCLSTFTHTLCSNCHQWHLTKDMPTEVKHA